jgi:hypothetical protein
MSRIYVETSIPSFYYEVRSEPEMVARRDWTRKWWNVVALKDSLCSSIAVVDELRKGNFPGKVEALELIENLPLLDIDYSVLEIVESYLLITSCLVTLLVMHFI